MSFIEKFVKKKGKAETAPEVIPTSVDFKAIAGRYQHPQDFVQGLQYEIGKTRKAFSDMHATNIALHGTKEWNTYRESAQEIEKLLAEYSKSADAHVYDALESEIEKMNASMSELRKTEHAPVSKNDAADGFKKEDKVGKGLSLDSAANDLTHAEKRELLRKAMEGLNPATPSPASSEDAPEQATPEEELELTHEQIVPEVDALDAIGINRDSKKEGKTREVAPEERQALSLAEAEYLSAYREFHRNKKVWNIAEPKNVKALEVEYTKARLAYAHALDNSLEDRFKEKLARRGINGSLERETPTGFKNDRLEKTRERYNRLVRFNEVIKPAAEKKTQARIDALGFKEQGIFLKALSWAGEKNKALEERFGKNGARAIRAVTSTALLAPVAFTGVGAAALAGWAGMRVGRSIVSSLAGGSLGAAAGAWYEKTRGKRKQMEAQESLSSLVRDARTMSLTSVDDLQDFEHSQESLTSKASDEYLRRNKSIIQVLTALGVGAGTASALSQWESLHTLASHPEPTVKAPPVEEAPPATSAVVHDLNDVTKPTASVGVSPKTIDLTHANHATIEQLGEKPSLHVEVSRGEGADKLLADLQERLRAQYPDIKTAPENIRALLNHGPHRTAELLGLGHESGGVMLHPGDTLGVDDQGRLVFHDNIHDRNRIIIDAKHELHPLKGHGAKVHVGETHKAHVTHTHEKHAVQHPRTQRDTFDVKADNEGVAAANRAELLREQKGQFQYATRVPETLAEVKTSEPEDISVSDEKITTLGDLQPSPEPSSVAEATPAPKAPEASVTTETTVPETASTEAGKYARLGEFSREIPPADNVITNHFGLAIDTKIPHVYVTENNHIDVYGGKGNAPRLIAEQYAKAHPGVTVRFQAWTPDALGNPTPYTGEITADTSGEILVHIPNTETEELLTPPDPETFIELK